MKKISEEEKRTFLSNLKETPELYATFFNQIRGKDLWYKDLRQFGYFDKQKIEESNTVYVSVYAFKYLNSIIDNIINDQNLIEDIIKFCKESILLRNINIALENIDILSKLSGSYTENFINELLIILDNNFEFSELMFYRLTLMFDNLIQKNDKKCVPIFKFIFVKYCKDKSLMDNFLLEEIENEKLYKSDEEIICEMIDNCIEFIVSLIQKCEILIDIKEKEYSVRIDYKDKILIIYRSDGEFIKEYRYKDRFDVYNFMKIFIKQEDKSMDSKEIENIAKIKCEDIFTNYESYHSIFEYEGYYSDTLSYCIALIKKLLLSLNSSKASKYIQVLFFHDLSMLSKLSIFLVIETKHTFTPEELREIVYSVKFEYIIRHYIFEDEIKELFGYLKKIDKEIERKINDIIENGPYIYYTTQEELNIWKQKRFKALKNIDYFQQKYKDMVKKTNVDYELSAPIQIRESGFVEQVSAISFDEMKSMTVNILIKKLNELNIKKFNSDDFLKEYSYIGLGETLKSVIISNPLQYINELYEFKKIDNYVYSVYIVQGLTELLRKQRNNIRSYWKSIVNYLIDIYFKYDFQKVNVDQISIVNRNRFYKALFSPITFMLDNNLIEEDMIDEIKEFTINISKQIAQFPVDKILWGNDDFMTYIISSVQGTYLNMVLALSLFLKRNNNKMFSKIWGITKKVIELFESKNDIDVNIFLGWNFFNFQYLDNDWIKFKLDNVADSKQWQYFIGGYCYSNHFSEEYYKIMYKDLKKALEFDFNDKNIKNRIYERIALGFLIGYEEKLHKSLYKAFLKCINYDAVYSFSKIAKRSGTMEIFNGIDYKKNSVKSN